MVRLNKTLIVALMLIFSSSMLPEAQAKTYTVDDAVAYALKSNRDLKSSAYEVKKAHAAVHEAYGYAMPSVDVSASLSHFLEKMKMPFPDFGAMLNNSTYSVLFKEKVIPEDKDKYLPVETSLQSFSLANNYEAKVQISQILFNSAVLTGIGSAGIYQDASKVMLKSQISKTVLGVQKAFYAALLMKEMYTVIQTSYNTFEQTVNNVKLLYEQGMVSEYNYLQVKVQLENFKPKVLEAENGLKLTIDALKMAMSMDKNENLDIAGEYKLDDIQVPDINTTVDRALRDNLDIQSLEYKRKVDDAFVDLARADYWPTVAAFGYYSFSGASDNLKFINYRTALIGVQFSINLFNGGRTQNKVEQQMINVMKTDEQIQAVRDATAMGVKAKLLDLQRIKDNIDATVENVKLAERAYSIAELRLKEGTGTQLELINSEQAKRESILNKYKAINDYYNAKFELDNLLGIVDSGYYKYFENELK